MAALCAWLAPLWLTILLSSLVAVGMVTGWIVEYFKAGDAATGG